MVKLGRGVRHQRPDADLVRKVISQIGKAAKIVVEQADEKTGRVEKFASAHDLRRSCGEQLREAGVPPLVISRVMRHSSWETTQRHYAPGNVQSDAEVLSQILATKPGNASAASEQANQQKIGLNSADVPRYIRGAVRRKCNTPGTIRTCDRRIRNPMVYYLRKVFNVLYLRNINSGVYSIRYAIRKSTRNEKPCRHL